MVSGGRARRLPFLAVVALVVWLGALFLVPATLAPGTVAGLDGAENRLDHADRWMGLPFVHGVTYGIGDVLCHQKSWRSFSVGGNQLPVDERMTAIFAGALPGLLLSFWLPVSSHVTRALDHVVPSRWRAASDGARARRWTLIVVVALLPAAVDVLWENGWGRESTMPLRVLTGSIAGVAGGLVLGVFLASVDRVFGERFTRRRRAAS